MIPLRIVSDTLAPATHQQASLANTINAMHASDEATATISKKN